MIPVSVISIGANVFYNCNYLADVYYSGTQSEWQSISINDRGNENLTNKATIHYNSTMPDNPPTPESSKLTLISSIPANGAEMVSKYSELTLQFSREINHNLNWANGTIRFVNYDTGETAFELDNQLSFLQLGGRVFDSTLVMDYVFTVEELIPGKYSILIDPGVIMAKELNSDGTLSVFSGISDKDELVFTLSAPTSTTFSVQFAKGSALVEWNDWWFQYPATTYIHKLAVASIALSAATYSDDESSDQIDYVLENELYFEDIFSWEYDWEYDWDYELGSAGFTFARKPVSVGNEQFTLVAIIVRGSKNTADWLSNFLDSGWVDGNSGFEDAAEEIMKELIGYCAAKDINYSNNVKFLVTGHSRGGLIANIIAAELVTQGVLDTHLSHVINQTDVYGYTFASPHPASFAVRQDCSNIWNVINYPDIVPKLPINFMPRYGVDLYLPHRIYHPRILQYDQFSEAMRREYRRLTGDDYHETIIGIFTQGGILGSIAQSGSGMLDFFRHIGEVHSSAAYYSWVSSYTADELFSTWMNPTYREITIACPVDVFVYDETGTLVASIVDDEVVVEELAVQVVIDDSVPGAQEKIKIVYLPTDQTYSIEIKATGEGTVSYTVREMEVTGTDGLVETDSQVQSLADKVLRTVKFNNIEIVEGDILTGKIKDPFFISATDYALSKNNITIIFADYDSLNPSPLTPSSPYLFLTGLNNSSDTIANASVIFMDGTMADVKVDMTASLDGPSDRLRQLSSWIDEVGNTSQLNSWFTYSISDGVYTLYRIPTTEMSAFTTVAQFAQDVSIYNFSSPDTAPTVEINKGHVALQTNDPVWYRIYGDNNTVYINVNLKKATADDGSNRWIIGGVESVTPGVQNVNLVVRDLAPIEDGYINPEFEIYSLYSDIGYIIAAVTIGENLNPVTPTPAPTPTPPPSRNDYSYDDNSDNSPLYRITVPSHVTGGVVKTVPTSASEGQRVTITAKPYAGYVLEVLTATDSKGNTLTLTDLGNGKYTFIMPNSDVSIDVSFEAIAPAINFTDVPRSAYYYDAVAWAVANGITYGITDTTFGPDVACTRAQIVSFLWRQAGSPKMGGDNPFTDVSAADYYYDAVLWAVANGITYGSTDTTFSPNAPCTRAQAMTFLYRDKKSPAVSGTGGFTDVPVGEYYVDAVQWALTNGVTYGTTDTTFSPDQDCTRAQIVSFLYRARAN